MQRRVFLLLAVMLTVPAFAKAAVLAPQGGSVLEFVEGSPDFNVTLALTLGQGEGFTDSSLRVVTNGGVGPAPAITHVLNDTTTAIPGANLAGTIWVNGNGGIGIDPNGTTSAGSGLMTVAGFQTPAAATVTTSGVYAILTFTLAGVGPGEYVVDLSGSDLFNGLDEETLDPLPVPLQVTSLTIRVVPVPEPSTIVLGSFAAAGLAAVAIRRRRRAA